MLHIADVEGTLWAKTHVMDKKNREECLPMAAEQSSGQTRICYVDDTWREQDKFTGQG